MYSFEYMFTLRVMAPVERVWIIRSYAIEQHKVLVQVAGLGSSITLRLMYNSIEQISATKSANIRLGINTLEVATSTVRYT